ncbi:MAG: hypothetical protein COB02_14955 [Candidatus Cloacimonadota bacterium]|nr:MAG: hypothetical protein COB02_14955 [Candidatus Cloacimonadota bacterium]
MYKKKHLLIVILLNLVFIIQSYFVLKTRVPVLLFHKIRVDANDKNQALSNDFFIKILNFLKKVGYQSFLPNDYIADDDKKVILSFDDGTNDHFKTVMPILNVMKQKGLFFWVNNSLIKLSQKEKKELLRVSKDHAIGAHTNKHEIIDSKTWSNQKIIKELESSKRGLESFFKKAIKSFAFAEGIYDKNSLKIAKTIFNYNFSVEYDYFYPHEKVLHGRMIVFPSTTLNEISAYLKASKPHKSSSYYFLCFFIVFFNILFLSTKQR